MYRRSKVKDFIEPSYTKAYQGLQNVSDYLKKQVDEANLSLAQYVNDNCACPAGMDMSSAVNEISGQEKGRTGVPDVIKTNYMPEGQVFSERGAPHQMIQPPANNHSSFVIHWQDIWTRANQMPIHVDETYEIFQRLGLPYDSGVAQSQLASQQLNRVVKTANFINGFAKDGKQTISPVEYVYFVMLFIYRDKHVVSERELADMTSWFLEQKFANADAAGCGLIHHIMESGEFKLTFGGPSQWFTFACAHPFYPGPQLQRQTMTKNL
jgi:hypothetical protein